eukprot:1157392-Pelagomonas_calceolata.AAC.1
MCVPPSPLDFRFNFVLIFCACILSSLPASCSSAAHSDSFCPAALVCNCKQVALLHELCLRHAHLLVILLPFFSYSPCTLTYSRVCLHHAHLWVTDPFCPAALVCNCKGVALLHELCLRHAHLWVTRPPFFLQPSYAPAWRGLGDLAREGGNNAHAVECYRVSVCGLGCGLGCGQCRKKWWRIRGRVWGLDAVQHTCCSLAQGECRYTA